MKNNFVIKQVLLVSIAAFFVCVSQYALAGTNNIANGSPHSEDVRLRRIDVIEKNLKMPRGARNLEEYMRFYVWPDSSHGAITAVFVHNGSSKGVKLVQTSDLPTIDDGGCDVIELRYSLRTKKVVRFFCHGVG